MLKVVKLGEISTLINGDRGKNYPSQSDIFENGEIPFINAGHLYNNYINFAEMNYITKEKFDKLNSGKVINGDILYCLRGSLGKKAIVKNIGQGAIASSLVIIRPNKECVTSEYLCMALESPSIRIQLEKSNNGSSQPNLSAESVRQYNIILPDIEEQAGIVNIISKVKGIISKRNAELHFLDNLIKSRFVEMFGDPVSNPKRWNKKSLLGLCNKLTDGTHFSPENLSKGEYKYITAKNIKESGFDLTNLTYVTKEIHEEIYSRCNPEYGDVLYIKDGVTTGIAMVNSLVEEFSLLSSVALLKQKRDILNGYYLCCVLNNSEMYTSIRKNMGGAAITRLTIAKLNVIEIPVPPLDLQNQFATFVQHVDKLKVEVQTSLEKTQLLFDSLMQKYFG